jgi:hypothetical protein
LPHLFRYTHRERGRKINFKTLEKAKIEKERVNTNPKSALEVSSLLNLIVLCILYSVLCLTYSDILKAKIPPILSGTRINRLMVAALIYRVFFVFRGERILVPERMGGIFALS